MPLQNYFLTLLGAALERTVSIHPYADAANVQAQSFTETVGSNTYTGLVASVFEADGAEHVLGNLGTKSFSQQNLEVTYSGPFESLDATGWSYSTSSPLGYLNSYASKLTRADGINFYFSNSTVISTEQDPNGNQIQFGTLGYTDTIGRFVPYQPEPGASNNTDTSNCTGPLPTIAAVTWGPPGQGGSNLNYKFCFASVPVEYPLDSGLRNTGAPWGVTLLQSVVLPNNTTWTFQYNDHDSGDLSGTNYGNLTSITMPTGGTINYTYSSNACGSGFSPPYRPRCVYTRTVNANDGAGPQKWTYNRSYYTYPQGSPSVYLEVNVVDPLNNSTVHDFQIWESGYETSAKHYDTTGTLLKTVLTTYNYSNGVDTESLINVVPTSVTTTMGNGTTSFVSYNYDSGFTFSNSWGPGQNQYSGIYGRTISTSEYGFGNGAPGGLMRATSTQYRFQQSPAYLNANLLQIPAAITVQDGSGNQVAQTTYGYDENNGSPQGAFGNQTSVTRWLNTNAGQSPITQTIYNAQGMPTKTLDARLNPVNYYYDGTGAFLKQITNALGQSVLTSFDTSSGLLSSTTDANVKSNHYWYDFLSRTTQINYPDTGQTSYCFSDDPGSGCQVSAPPYSVVRTKVTGAGVGPEVQTGKVDGIGRLVQKQLNSDPDGTDYTDTIYDLLGRTSSVSHSHRSTPYSTDGITQYGYDGLSRTTQIIMPDGSTVNTNYSAFPCVTVTDEAGRSRRTCSDALGRITQVFEDPSTTVLQELT
jgi:YD repeat-containing protein